MINGLGNQTIVSIPVQENTTPGAVCILFTTQHNEIICEMLKRSILHTFM